MRSAHVRKISDAEDATRCLAEAQASGRLRREWAHENGIDARSLHMWSVILARRAPTPRFHLVELVTRPEPALRVYRVCAGEFMVEVGDDFDEATLGRLLRTVRSC
jgi:hypothetical protein